jgi:5-methylcytosine-specific restriction endonuclease McrA
MNYWTSLLSAKEFDNLMADADSPTATTTWSTHKLAKPDDITLFYVTGPISSFIATATITRKCPHREGERWPHADMRGLRRCATPYHIRDARSAFPEWGWLRNPMQSARIPNELVSKLFRKLIGPDATGVLATKATAEEIFIPNDDENPPQRVQYLSPRIVRTTKKGMELKKLYGHACQCCSMTINVPRRQDGYVEVHHLRPLGGEHEGMDHWNNMIVLCPNCHAAFDLLALAIDPKSGRVRSFGSKPLGESLRFNSQHRLAPANIAYHWNRYLAVI